MLVQVLTLLLATISCTAADQFTCPDDMIRCGSGEERCISTNQICDGHQGCYFRADEEICKIWRQGNCTHAKAYCNDKLGCILKEDYCHPENRCDGGMDYRVCLILEQKELQSMETFPKKYGSDQLKDSVREGRLLNAMVPLSLKHQDCPLLHTRVADRCLSLLFMVNVTWGEAGVLCKVLRGQLATFPDSSQFLATLAHLADADLSADFWVGGRHTDNGWAWLDDTPMSLDPPYWAMRYEEKCLDRWVHYPSLNVTEKANEGHCYHYMATPHFPPRDACVAMTYRHRHLLTDEDCLLRKGAICAAAD